MAFGVAARKTADLFRVWQCKPEGWSEVVGFWEGASAGGGLVH